MADAIRRFRASPGDTQKAFAKRTGLALTTVARYESATDETDFPPSHNVLSSFAGIARSENLPLFAQIFDGRTEPDELDLRRQDFAALKRSLAQREDSIHPDNPEHLRRGRLALAAFLTRDIKAIEQHLERTLAIVDELIQKTAGELIRNHDPEIEPTHRRRRVG